MAPNSKKLKIDSLEGNTFEDEYISSTSSPHIEDRQAGYEIIVTRAVEMAKVLLAKVK